MPTVVNLSPLFNGYQGFTAAGLPLAGGFINTYIAGTSTPQATYTTIAGNVANANPIQLGPDGRPPFEIWLVQGQAYKFVLTDSLGLNPQTYDNISGVGDASSLLFSLAAPSGATLVGWMQLGMGAVPRTVSAKLDEVFLPSVKDYGAVGDGVTVDLGAIQAAYAANSDVYWPNGTYNLGNSSWTPPVKMRMLGQSRRGVKITRTGSGPIVTMPLGAFDPYFENIEFSGSGNTGVIVASTAGTLQGYLLRAHFMSCDFDYDLAYGINADMIFGTVEKCTFGYYGTGATPAPGASTFVAIRSYVYPATSNFTNLNVVRNCIFQFAGSSSQAAVDINGGSQWVFDSNDWEQGGAVLTAQNVQMIKFIGANWVEGNVATNGLITIGACSVVADCCGVNIGNNTCRSAYQYASGSTKGLNIYLNTFALNSPSYAIYDATSLTATLPGDGSISFYQNLVVGGNAGNKCVTDTEFRGGKTSPRLSLSGNTTTPGTIYDSNDPGCAVSYNGVGDVSISGSHPFATATTKVRALATGQVAEIARVVVVNASQVRVQFKTAAGAAVDGQFSLEVYGG